jgi:hypothetical protein
VTRGQGTVVVVLLSVILVAICANLIFGGKAQVVCWEYKVVSVRDYQFEETMKNLGARGWELAFARRALSGGGEGFLSSLSEGVYECIFKRPKPLR